VYTRGQSCFPGLTLNPAIRVPAALPARARRKASASLAAAEAAPGEAPGCELYPVPCNLGVFAMDESTIELNFSADADEHGAGHVSLVEATENHMTAPRRAVSGTCVGPSCQHGSHTIQ